MTVRLVLFDCDGTLVDSAAIIVSTMRHAFTSAGLPPPADEEVRAIIGLSLDLAIGRLATAHPEAPIARLVEAYKTSYRDHALSGAAPEPMFPGTVAAIDALDDPETLLGVVTGKSRRGLDRVLAAHGLGGRFAVTVTADDAPSKPAPDMVLAAMAATGADPSGTVVIGDTTFDVQMARTAGASAIGVAWGYHPAAALVEAGAGAVAARMEDLPGLVGLAIRGASA